MPEITDATLRSLSVDDLRALETDNIEGMSLSGLRKLENNGKESFFRDNLDLVGSVVGGVGGSFFGPAGAVAGGAAGAAAGEALEDLIAGRSIDAGGVAKAGAISGAIDVATLGVGRAVRPFLRTNTARGLGARFNQILGKDAAAGSPASRAQALNLVGEGGATLDPRVFPDVGALRKIFTELGEVGFVSREFFGRDLRAGRKALTDTIKKWSDSPEAVGVAELGQTMFNVNELGRKAASDRYGDALKELVAQSGGKKISLAPIQRAIGQFAKDNTDELGLKLSPRAATEFKSIRDLLTDVKEVNFQTASGIQTRLSAAIDDAMPTGSAASPTVVRELSQLRKSLTEGLDVSLNKSHATLGKQFRALNSTYGEAMGGIVPDMSMTLLANAKNKGNFHALGSMLTSTRNPSQLTQFMKSVDDSYRAVAKNNLRKGTVNIDMPAGLETAEKAKKVIRDSFVREMFQEAGEDTVFNKGSIKRILKDEDRLKAVFGEEWPKFKVVLNSISDQMSGAKSGAFSLMLRSREAQAGLVAAAGGYGALTGGGEGAAQWGGLAALGIFGLPVVAYKIATNPRAVRRLSALENKIAAEGENIKPSIVASSIAKILNELSSDDMESIREQL